MVERLQYIRRRALWLLLLPFVLFSIISTGADRLAMKSMLEAPVPIADKQEWVISFKPKERYRLAKLEPEQGVYLGAYVLQDDSIGQSMERFNAIMGKRHASYFKYVGYGQPFPQEWAEQVKAAGAFPHIAWEPNNGLQEVVADSYMEQFADAAAELGVPVFLRFASEMNGTWTNYSGDPELYKEKWRLVHKLFQEHASNVAMVWTVLAMPESTIDSFYPGDEYVDWVGVNVYNVRYHNGSLKQRADYEDPLDLIAYVYNRYSRTKPIQLSEFGVTHFNTTDNALTLEFAEDKLERLYGSLERVYPRVKAVFYFNVNNVTAFNESRRINDYSLTNEQRLINSYSRLTSSPYYLSDVPAHAKAGVPIGQTFTYYGNVFKEGGVLFADKHFFESMMGLYVELNTNKQGEHTAIVRRKDAGGLYSLDAIHVPVVKRYMWKGINSSSGLPLNRLLYGMPLMEISAYFGYTAFVEGTSIYIQE